MTSTRPAVLFDVDGTLLDTNYFHTVSWWQALCEAGEDIAMSRIHPLIGMGSDQLLTDLLGEEREGLSDLHAKYYKPYKKQLHAFPKAAEVLAEVARRGALVVLATSSKEEDLDQLLEALGPEDGVIDEIVHGDMVGSSKPAPDIFAVALDRLDLDPADTMVVGDTRWDIEAAAKIGLDVVTVLTGGWIRRDLADAGAVAVYEDVAELLAELDDSPLARLLK
ncbi:MAG TPA: HAD family hydrolase [Acidimicrobiales bacterium]|nr:HAD family hydrolase [Acidimicrobiales bacterium]HWI04633.1 HAD family hydrolase [Acidimicrobiales bacterium]